VRARVALALLLAAALPAAPAMAAPEQVQRAEVRWNLGDRLDGRLARSCIRPRGDFSQTGAATGTVDVVARSGAATLSRGELQFRRTRRASRGTRTLRLQRLGVELSGQGGFRRAADRAG
jgi:hypothetical protein